MNISNYNLARFLCIFILCLSTSIACAADGITVLQSGVPAFPGAEGFGAMSAGGRGGAVYEVTTLDDSGPGSLRDAVSQSNRIIVFRVAGNIQLKSKLDIKANNLTIAGQTAPGGGICIRDYCVLLHGNNLVIRHLRFRMGDETKQESDSLTVWKAGQKNNIIDHCSVSWSVDEALSLAGDEQYITVQWCFITEALRHSVHVKGDHGFGSLSRANGPVTWHHNLWAHNDARNPRLGDNYGKDPRPIFDVRNNVIYDYGSAASGLTQGIFQANYVANYLKPGPNSRAKTALNVGEPSDLHFYVEGNVFEAKPELAGEKLFNHVEAEGKRVVTVVEKPFETAYVTTTSAKQAYEDVLAKGGATLPMRDSVDARIVEEVKNRTGNFINSQTDVGGWPELSAGKPVIDTDHDGMPDDWETAHKLNPSDPADGKIDPDNDGYDNLEECLNATDPNQFVDYRIKATK